MWHGSQPQVGGASAGFLEKHQAVYVTDSHTMPSVARVFALPKMLKYPQRIVLVKTAVTLAWVSHVAPPNPDDNGRLFWEPKIDLERIPSGCFTRNAGVGTI